jgi:hypothetical protein
MVAICTLPKTIIDPRLFYEMFLKSWNSTKTKTTLAPFLFSNEFMFRMRISRRIPYIH